jgi:hypothetical protein
MASRPAPTIYSPEPPAKTTWGSTLADALTSWPRLQHLCRQAGVTADPTDIISALQTPSNASTALQALFNLVEEAMNHQTNQADSDTMEWQTKVTTLQLRIDELTTALTHVASIQPGGNTSLRRISDDPDKFGGTEKDITKRQQEYVNWRSQLQRCFGMDQHVFNTEYRRIQHVASLLKGDAYDLFRDSFETVTQNPTDVSQWAWKTHTEVFTTLNNQYATLDLSRQARIDFDNLWMTKKPFQNFIAEFTKLSLKSGKTELQKVEALKVKVSQELADVSTNKDNKPAPDDFDGWCKRFHTIYQDLQEKAHLDALRQNRIGARRQNQEQNNYQSITAGVQPQPQNTSEPMVLDIRGPRPSRDQCIQQGLCFYCKLPGHSKSTCPEKARNNAKYGHPPRVPQPNQQFPTTQLPPPSPGALAPRQPSPRPFFPPRQQQTPWNSQTQYFQPSPRPFFPPRQQQAPWNSQTQYFQPSPLNRLRTHGFIESETPSTTSSPSPGPATPTSVAPSRVGPENE